MYIEWRQQAQGFNQATYPCKNYNLSADLMTEKMVDGRSKEQCLTPLGSVTVEEAANGSLKFLFGSQLAFWPGVYKKLENIEISSEQLKKIEAELEKKFLNQFNRSLLCATFLQIIIKCVHYPAI